MGYYGQARNYAAGDNYGRMGNYPYQAGGIFSTIGNIVKGGIRLISSAVGVPQPVQPTVMDYQRALAAGPLPNVQIPVPKDYPGAVKKPGTMGAIERALPGGASGYILGKKRRMDYGNTKALKRANRRRQGFVKLVRSSLKGSGLKLVSSHSGRGGGSRGVITRAEAARALRK